MSIEKSLLYRALLTGHSKCCFSTLYLFHCSIVAQEVSYCVRKLIIIVIQSFVVRSFEVPVCSMAEGSPFEGVNGFSEDHCVIYKLEFETESPINVTKKGALSLISYSNKSGKSELHTYLM